MTYDTLVQTAAKKIPEFKTCYENLLKLDEIDKDTGVHIVFEYAFDPLVIEAVKTKNDDLCKRLFDFIELIASDKNVRVSEVCDVSIIERLYGELEPEEIIPYLGKSSKEAYDQVGTYMY